MTTRSVVAASGRQSGGLSMISAISGRRAAVSARLPTLQIPKFNKHRVIPPLGNHILDAFLNVETCTKWIASIYIEHSDDY